MEQPNFVNTLRLYRTYYEFLIVYNGSICHVQEMSMAKSHLLNIIFSIHIIIVHFRDIRFNANGYFPNYDALLNKRKALSLNPSEPIMQTAFAYKETENILQQYLIDCNGYRCIDSF